MKENKKIKKISNSIFLNQKENPKKQQKQTNKKTDKNTEKNTEKKFGIIVLDLDETLFHTENNKIYYRPYVTKFLSYINKYFYLVVYTAALKTYADKILIKLLTLDVMKKLFILKLYRNSVTSNGKDLSIVLKKLIKKKKINKIPSNLLYKKNNNKIIINYDNIILIDNLVENFLDTQLFNGIPIIDYYKNNNDNALILLIKFFKHYIVQKNNKPKLTLKKYLYNNLYKINSICKIKYEKCLNN